jgi:hypothetical protein
MRPFLLIWALLTLAGMLLPLPASFTVGVLRRDALIVPFATYDGKRWQNYWPVPGNNTEVPLSLRNVSKGWWGPVGPRDMWQSWVPDSPPRMLKVLQPDWAPSFCQKQVGLRADYQPQLRPPPAGASPYPKDGLAVSPPYPVEPIDVLGPDSRERDDVLEAIHPRFVEREGAVLLSMRTQYLGNPSGSPAPPDEKELRAMPPMVIEGLYAYGATRRTYFVETAREYKRKGACTFMTFGKGRLIREQGRFSVDSFGVGIGFCDRSNITYMLPLGVMSLPTGMYWLAQYSGWTREVYHIIDIGPHSRTKDQVTPGGGC